MIMADESDSMLTQRSQIRIRAPENEPISCIASLPHNCQEITKKLMIHNFTGLQDTVGEGTEFSSLNIGLKTAALPNVSDKGAFDHSMNVCVFWISTHTTSHEKAGDACGDVKCCGKGPHICPPTEQFNSRGNVASPKGALEALSWG
uniref:Uncharacterized protein n=2 Tax=Opuntia streptacantha TaxID=393608 RepID=A0A7C8YRX3_OPUST